MSDKKVVSKGRGRPALTDEEKRVREINQLDKKIYKIGHRLIYQPQKPKGRGRPQLGREEMIKLMEQRNKLADQPLGDTSKVIMMIKKTELLDLMVEYKSLEKQMLSKKAEIQNMLVI